MDEVTLFLCGDVMTGRGIDQVLRRSVDPALHEPYVESARRYVELAEAENGPIPAPVAPDYIWGEALAELERVDPAARIVNLETAVTTADDAWEGKGIHYRMHPENVPVLRAAGIDVCSLANNHVLDWGYAGLRETLETLKGAGLRTCGAGSDRQAARAPAIVEGRPGGRGRGVGSAGSGGGERASPPGRVLVLGLASVTSGVPWAWTAGEGRPGVRLLPDLSAETADRIAGEVRDVRRGGDVVVISVHWGENWGYRIPARQREFAHRLIDGGGADIVHGHSSHHPKGIEVHGGRPILYGCGDFLNDYEGIAGREEFRGDLTLMYFPRLDASGGLRSLRMTPMRIRRFRLERAPEADAAWLRERLDRECRKLGARVEGSDDGRLALGWD